MVRRTVLAVTVTVALMVAACAPATTESARPLPSPADPLLRAFIVDPATIPRLGLTLNPVAAGQGRLAGPNFAFTMTHTGTAPALSPEQMRLLGADTTTAPARPGTEYLVVVADERDRFSVVKESGRNVEAVFHVGDRQVSRSVVGNVLVVETPVGAPVSVDVTSAERTQRMDLRTGRGSNLIDGYYPRRTGQAGWDCQVNITQPGVTLKDVTNNIAVSLLVDALLLPYLQDKGWAPAGRQWLSLTIHPDVASDDPDVAVTFDLATDLAVVGPTGRLPIADRYSPTGGSNQNQLGHVADVPAGPLTLTLTYTFSGAVTYKGQPVRNSRWGAPTGGNKPCGATDTITL